MFQATGGSGKYQWNSDTVDVVGVSRLGVVTSVHPGKAIITVSDVRNSDHFDQALVSLIIICVIVQCQYTIVPVYHCTSIPLHQYTIAPVYHCTSIPVYHCTSVPLHQFTIAPVYHCTSIHFIDNNYNHYIIVSGLCCSSILCWICDFSCGSCRWPILVITSSSNGTNY